MWSTAPTPRRETSRPYPFSTHLAPTPNPYPPLTDIRGHPLPSTPSPQACTIVLRGASRDVLNEVERNLSDAMGVARNVAHDPRLLPGGGAVEMAISKRLSERANAVGGTEQLAYRAVAAAVEVVPRTLAQNCGCNVIRTLTKVGRGGGCTGQRGAGYPPAAGCPALLFRSRADRHPLTDLSVGGVLCPLWCVRSCAQSTWSPTRPLSGSTDTPVRSGTGHAADTRLCCQSASRRKERSAVKMGLPTC